MMKPLGHSILFIGLIGHSFAAAMQGNSRRSSYVIPSDTGISGTITIDEVKFAANLEPLLDRLVNKTSISATAPQAIAVNCDCEVGCVLLAWFPPAMIP
jgi:hypothetical protein